MTFLKCSEAKFRSRNFKPTLPILSSNLSLKFKSAGPARRNGSAGACRDRRQGQSKRHALLGRHCEHGAGRGSRAGTRGSREGGRRVLPEGRPGIQVIVLHLAASRDELAWFHSRIGEMRSIYADSRVLTARLRSFANSVIINMPIPLTQMCQCR